MAASPFVVGVDLGGTNIVVGAVSADGARQTPVHTQPTPVASGATAVVEQIATMIKAAIADAKTADASRAVVGVGVGSPGPLDRAHGATRPWHSGPPWCGQRLRIP